MRTLVGALSCSFLVAACSAPGDAEYDAKVPGTLLGTFAVVGKLDDDECGADLMNAPDPWRFDVRLSRFQNDLYWLNGREAIVGDVDSKNGFRFSTRVDVPVTPRRGSDPGCTVSRYDSAEGALTASGDEVTALRGVLEFEYRSKRQTECLEIIGVPGGFNNLPCKMSYSIRAERIAEP